MKFFKWVSPGDNNALLQFPLKLECCKLHKAAHHPTKRDLINDIKLFPTVDCRIVDVIQSDLALQKPVH